MPRRGLIGWVVGNAMEITLPYLYLIFCFFILSPLSLSLCLDCANKDSSSLLCLRVKIVFVIARYANTLSYMMMYFIRRIEVLGYANPWKWEIKTLYLTSRTWRYLTPYFAGPR